MNIEGKTVCIIGCARSGQAAARLAFEKGARVRISDCAGSENVSQEFLAWAEGNAIETEWGGHTQDFLKGCDYVVISPGVPPAADPVVWAEADGIEAISELEFAFQYCPAPIIAVTGSNGKTTVSTLIAEVLKAVGRKVCLCGNIGSPLSAYVNDISPDQYVVLEVSSFQLEKIKTFKPFIAVCLNISQNHLDRHADMQEYISAKLKIFANQSTDDFSVLNAKDQTLMRIKDTLPSCVVEFGSEDMIQETGLDNPNYLAVVKVAEICGVFLDLCQRVFEGFKGIEHRLEYVRTINGIDFINDSKSTTVEASRWALERQDKPVIWICGGRDKGLDFSVLKDTVRDKVRLIIAIGEAADKIEESFKDIIDIEKGYGSLDDAVALACKKADSGDSILFSPMCASFDMFEDYEHRGREFKRIVNDVL